MEKIKKSIHRNSRIIIACVASVSVGFPPVRGIFRFLALRCGKPYTKETLATQARINWDCVNRGNHSSHLKAIYSFTYPLTESALLGLAGLSGCCDRPELEPSRDLALFVGGPSLWRPCETVLIILRTEYRKSNSPRFSIENTRVFLVLMSMAPKLMSLTGETTYLL